MHTLYLLLLVACTEGGEAAGDSESADPCADPGSYTIECVDADGTLLRDAEGTCEEYASHGHQAFTSMESTCQEEHPGCVCSRDLSACAFPCDVSD